jgi:HSP20 family molecular chaperone IbpA
MTKVTLHRNPFFDRDQFLTPFDKIFDAMIEEQFPEVAQQVGVTPYQGSAYPKVNVYEYDDKVGIVA